MSLIPAEQDQVNSLPAPNIPSVVVSSKAYREELDALGGVNGTFPVKLTDILKKVIASYLDESMPIGTTLSTLELAKIHLAKGIQIIYPGSEQVHLFDLVVYVPDDATDGRLRSFFKLITKYPYGRLKYLHEV